MGGEILFFPFTYGYEPDDNYWPTIWEIEVGIAGIIMANFGKLKEMTDSELETTLKDQVIRAWGFPPPELRILDAEATLGSFLKLQLPHIRAFLSTETDNLRLRPNERLKASLDSSPNFQRYIQQRSEKTRRLMDSFRETYKNDE